MDDVKPPAPPVGSGTSVPLDFDDAQEAAAKKALAEADAQAKLDHAKAEAQYQERAKAEPIKFKRPEIYETLKGHLEEANGPAVEGGHPRVHEHAAIHGLNDVREFDASTGTFTTKPHWKMRVLLAWWKAHGLEHHSRISPKHFEAALHEALHGRV